MPTFLKCRIPVQNFSKRPTKSQPLCRWDTLPILLATKFEVWHLMSLCKIWVHSHCTHRHWIVRWLRNLLQRTTSTTLASTFGSVTTFLKTRRNRIAATPWFRLRVDPSWILTFWASKLGCLSKRKQTFKSNFNCEQKRKALPRIELGFPDSKSEVLTTILQGLRFFVSVSWKMSTQMTE